MDGDVAGKGWPAAAGRYYDPGCDEERSAERNVFGGWVRRRRSNGGSRGDRREAVCRDVWRYDGLALLAIGYRACEAHEGIGNSGCRSDSFGPAAVFGGHHKLRGCDCRGVATRQRGGRCCGCVVWGL